MKPWMWAAIMLVIAFCITGYIDMQEAERLSLKGYVSDHR